MVQTVFDNWYCKLHALSGKRGRLSFQKAVLILRTLSDSLSNAEIVIMGTEPFKSRTVKHFPVIRMGYADKELRPFLKGLSVKVHHSVFRHDVMGVGPWSNDSGSGIACLSLRLFFRISLAGI